MRQSSAFLIALFALMVSTIVAPASGSAEQVADAAAGTEGGGSSQEFVLQPEPKWTPAGRVAAESAAGMIGYLGGAYVGLAAGAIAAFILYPPVWSGEGEQFLMASAITGTATGAIVGGTALTMGTAQLLGVRDKNIWATALGFAVPMAAGAGMWWAGAEAQSDLLVQSSLLVAATAPIAGAVTLEHTAGHREGRTTVGFRPGVRDAGGSLVLSHTF